MNRFSLPRLVVIGTVLVWIALGCSHGSNNPVSPGEDNRTADVSITIGPATEEAGEIVYPVTLEGVKDIGALSFRIGFDPDGLEPAGVEWGGMVREDDATFGLMNRRGFVPLAFARMSGSGGLNADGELCRMRFRIRDHERVRAWLVDDPGFLVAKNSFGHRLRMRVRGEGQ
jgi:ribosomal protein S6E (S10)